MPRPTVKFTGEQELLRNLRRIARNAPVEFRAALRYRAELIMSDSKKNYVPVDWSSLMNSGHVAESPDHEFGMDLVYGGPSAPYALAVHEHLSIHSPRSWRIAESTGGGVVFSPRGHGPKYLEKPLRKAQKTLLTDLGDDLKVGSMI